MPGGYNYPVLRHIELSIFQLETHLTFVTVQFYNSQLSVAVQKLLQYIKIY